MLLKSGEYQFEIDGNDLLVRMKARRILSVPLVPRVDGETPQAGTWAQIGPEHYELPLAGFGVAHVAVREGHVCYWVETERKHIGRLTYFPDSHPTQSGWHTFLSDELDRYWNLDENTDVPISSAYIGMNVDGEDGAGMTDPGDKPPTWIWNVPPRALAIETPAGWMGLSIPGPLSVGVTRFTMQRGVFNLTFEELRPTAAEWGPPRVYFFPGLIDPYDALDEHRRVSERCGLTRKLRPSACPDWWTHPSFKCADEVYRENNRQWVVHEKDGRMTTSLTTENWLKWVGEVEQYTGLRGKLNLQVDQIFFYGYGGRRVLETLGGAEAFRKTIDDLRQRGNHVGLYLHLYVLDPTATDFPARHADACCKPKDPATVVKHGVPVGSQNLVYVDWTHPEGRRYMLEHIEWLLSDRPGCLNGDWLLINNNLAPDPRLFEFHDPQWGTGDLMTMKAAKLAYEHAKKIKPHCYVRRQSPGDSYMQPYCDQANLCEEWNGQTAAWYRRARIATRTLSDVVLHLDAWFVTKTKLTEYYFGLSAIFQPEIESVHHTIHPYMYWREMVSKDYRRIQAGVQACMNAPIDPTDECRVNLHEGGQPEIWRKRRGGPLAGWYAALALHKRTVVTYSESQALIASSQEWRVTVPLPPRARLEAVEAIAHDGSAAPHPYELLPDEQNSVRLWAPDAGGEIMHVRLRYTLD